MMDLLPTLARLADAKLPERTIDGHDIRPLIFGEEDAKTPYDAFFYYHKGQLHAVRSGKWKLYLANERKLVGLGDKREPFKVELYDLVDDLSEMDNVAPQHPEIVRQLTTFANTTRAELGDNDRTGNGQRQAGVIENPQPRLQSEPASVPDN